MAIAAEGKAKAISSGDFVRKYKLQSASSVSSAVKGLLEKDFITYDKGIYQVYDPVSYTHLTLPTNREV